MLPPYFARVYKQGHSFGLVIPSRIRHAMGIERGDYFSVACLNDHTIVLELIQEQDFAKIKPKVLFTGPELMGQ